MFTTSADTGSGIEAANMFGELLSWFALEPPLMADSGAQGVPE